MIEGIEVLSEIQVSNDADVFDTIIGAVLFLIFGTVITLWIDSVFEPNDKPSLIAGIVSVVITIIYLVSGVIYCYTHLHSHYEVIISEDVNFKEFLDTYNIIDTRGKIYIIEEKENTDDRN